MSKVGRNDFCPCGSGKKYKQCCMGQATKAAQAPSLEALWQMANSSFSRGALDEALSYYRQVVSLKPSLAQAHYNMGVILLQQEKLDQAASSFQRTIALKSDYADAHNNLGYVLSRRGDYEGSVACFKKAISHEPSLVHAYHNLGTSYRYLWNLEEAVAAFKKSHSLRPDDASIHSDLLMLLHYGGASDEELFREHLSWGEKHGRAAALNQDAGAWEVTPSTDRKLRVGYVSGDMRRHPVGFFLRPLLAHHCRDRFEIYCYSERSKNLEDEMTAELKSHADGWKVINGLNNASVAQMIRKDRIDILIDLSGHSAGNRLQVFAMKPAPLQATWLGYPDTTGLKEIDYRITDDVADPPGVAENFNSEQLLRVKDGFLCYSPPPDAPEAGPLPAVACGHITFGSFNNLAKLSPQTISLWARILNQVQGAQLLLKYKGFSDKTCRTKVEDAFAAHGVPRERLQLVSYVESFSEHLELYNRIDLALDTFPYNGTTTTCEALWMGVPVLTLSGSRHSARVGASIISRLGLQELVTGSEEDYLRAAVELAADVERLSLLRKGMRQRLLASPLCGAPGFAGRMEAALSEIWRKWCSEQRLMA